MGEIIDRGVGGQKGGDRLSRNGADHIAWPARQQQHKEQLQIPQFTMICTTNGTATSASRSVRR